MDNRPISLQLGHRQKGPAEFRAYLRQCMMQTVQTSYDNQHLKGPKKKRRTRTKLRRTFITVELSPVYYTPDSKQHAAK